MGLLFIIVLCVLVFVVLVARTAGNQKVIKQKSLPALKAIGTPEPFCPYCGSELEKMPGRKKKCPDSGEFIFVRTRPLDRKKVLITEDQIEQIEEQRAIAGGWHDEFLDRKDKFEKERARLEEQFGSEPSHSDIRWSLWNKELIEHAVNGNWGFYRNVKFSMAEQLRAEARLKGAVSFYFQVCYLDLNGPRNLSGNTDEELLAKFPPFERRLTDLAPGIVERIQKCIEKAGLSTSEVEELFKETVETNFQDLNLPVTASEAWEVLKTAGFQQ